MTLAERMLEDSRLMAKATPPIKALDLVSAFRIPLAEKWGYIWGKRGQAWTQANQDAATREMTVKYGQKWVGRKVADCSGMFVWAYKRFGASIYHGSDTIWRKYTSMTGRVEGTLSIRPGTAVFMENDGKRTHIGLYVGGGKCIEAQGTRTGVVESDISRWDEWGQLTDVDYEGVSADEIRVALPTLRRGDEGAAVKELQTILNADSRYGGLEVDGVYGRATMASVRAFQGDHGLTPDGICGPLTWAKLQQREDDDDEDKPEEAPDGPQEPEEDTPEDSPMTVEERLTRLEEAVFGQEGGESDGLDPSGG